MASVTACRIAPARRSSRLAASRAASACRPDLEGPAPSVLPGLPWRSTWPQWSVDHLLGPSRPWRASSRGFFHRAAGRPRRRPQPASSSVAGIVPRGCGPVGAGCIPRGRSARRHNAYFPRPSSRSQEGLGRSAASPRGFRPTGSCEAALVTDTLPATPHPRASRVALWLIHAYQVARVGHVSPCRFTPTCSEYAVQAISTHGTRRGVALLARRLVRCRPGGPFGYDPVPPLPERPSVSE
jgi:uncharacterized protein